MAYSAVDDYLTPTRAAYWGSAHRRTATPTNTYRPSSSAAYHRAASPAWEERYGYSRDSGASPTTPRNQYIQQQPVQPQARSSYYYSASPSSAGYRPYDDDAASPSTPRSQYVARGRDTTPRYVDPSYSVQPVTHYQASPPRLHHPTSYVPSAPVYDAPATPRGAVGGASANRWVATGSYAASPQPPLREASPVRATPTLSTRSRRAPSMIKDPLATFLPPQPSSESHRLCLALDLDETLVYARDGPVHVRPFAQEFLRQLYDMDCEVIVWTAGERDYAQSVIRQIDPMGTIEHCVYRHAKWWTGQVGYSKNLRALGRNLSRTLLVDNTPDCLKEHPQHGLLVSDFEGPRGYDDCLRTLLRVVQCIIDRPHDSVPRVLADCPDVLRRTVPLDAGGSVTVWTLANDDVIGRSDYQSARYNRDSPPRSQSRGRW